MKKLLGMAVILVAFTMPVQAQAANGNDYVSIGGGVNFADTNAGSDIFKTGFVLSGALGYRFNKNLRTEFEINYRDNDINSQIVDAGVTAWGGLANVYLDMSGIGPVPEDSKFVPYLTAGGGLAEVDINVVVSNVSFVFRDYVFAYQAGAGFGYDITAGGGRSARRQPGRHRMTLDLGYRYYATEDLELAGVKVEYNNHSVLAGIRYSF